MSYRCPTCGEERSCWTPSIIGLSVNDTADEAARMRATLEIVKAKLKVDDPDGLYDIVCAALVPARGGTPEGEAFRLAAAPGGQA